MNATDKWEGAPLSQAGEAGRVEFHQETKEASHWLFVHHRSEMYLQTDRVMAYAMMAQAVAAFAIFLVMGHVAMIIAGCLLASGAAAAKLKAGNVSTRWIVAVSQVFGSIAYLSTGTDESAAQLHACFSLALLAMYREWPVVAAAAAGLSVSGVAVALTTDAISLHRATEAAGWLCAAAGVLSYSCLASMRQLRDTSEAQAVNALESERTESAVIARTRELVEAQHEMYRERELLTNVMSHIPYYVVWKDRDLVYRGCNTAFAGLVGLASPKDIEGKQETDLPVELEEAAVNQQQDAIVIATGRALLSMELSRVTAGKSRQYLASKVPMRDESGEVVGVLSIYADITDRKALEASLAQAQKLESIGQLAAGIAHEINTPVQYVSDNTRFLESQFGSLLRVVESYAKQLDVDAGAKSWDERRQQIQKDLEQLDYEFARVEVPAAIDQSLDGLERVSTIVRAMKDFSHPGSADKQLLDINKAIASTVVVCTHRWKYVADLKTEFDPNLPMIPCLVAEFNQVILNMVVNAADAIAEKQGNSGAKGLITVSTRAGSDFVEIRVSDNGSGIPVAVQPRLFTPFFTTKGVGKGTGQGLAISRSIIVDKHAGEMTFESQPGVGTSFIVRLPVIAQNEQEVAQAA
jgi:PAS domain S-box-containing protein